jgi:hypothetical protein
MFGFVAWREERDDASRWAAPGPWLLHAWRGQAGFGWAALGCAGVGGKGWLLGRAWLPAGFWPTAKLILKFSFLFPCLFIICKLI